MAEIHESLLETDDAEVEIETTADVIKPVFASARKLVSEMKLRVNSDGLSYDVVDPANVIMLGMDVPGAAFDTFDVDETVIGIPLKSTMGALRGGRKNQNDDIRMSYANEVLSTRIGREYDETHLDLENSIKTIDPNSIRKEPDPPDLEYSATATIPVDLFDDVVTVVDERTDYLRIREAGGDLVMGGSGETDETRAVVSGVLSGEGADAMFATDYLKDFVKALKTVGVDHITMNLGEEFPVHIEWEAELNDTPVTGYWLQAPRIQSE